jgi:hypothetical protein
MMTGAIIGTIAIVLVTVIVGVLLDRKLPLLGRPQEPGPNDATARKAKAIHASGEAPATALRVAPGQLHELRTSQRCTACRRSMETDPDDHVRYDDSDLLVLHFHCGRCGAKRSLYATEHGP